MLEIMCMKGKDCSCARPESDFDVSLNRIGAYFGLAGIKLLRDSRTAELQDFFLCTQQDKILQAGGCRRSLIQISRCPGIGKTTLPGLLAMQHHAAISEAGTPQIIGSLVTFNGIHITSEIMDVDMQSALCIRVMYGALSCHSSVESM